MPAVMMIMHNEWSARMYKLEILNMEAKIKLAG
jgi:hypothetical protein